MMQEIDYRKALRKFQSVLFAGISSGILMMLLYVFIFGRVIGSSSNHGDGVLEIVVAIASILPMLMAFIVPVMLAERLARRRAVLCPECDADLSRNPNFLLQTRRCYNCAIQVIAGRPHKASAYKKYQQIRSARLLWFYLWFWPILTLSLVLAQLIGINDTAVLAASTALVGLAASTWATFRVSGRKYLLQLMVTGLVALLGAMILWQWINS